MRTSRSRFPPALALIGVIALLVLLLWGCNSLGGPQPFGRLLQPAAVTLVAPMPRTVHVAQLDVTGQTRPRAFVKAIVDTTELQQVVVADSGRYDLHVPLPEVGPHLVRIEVRYGAADNPVAEALTRTVTRTTDPLPTPRILAVTRMVTRDSYAVVVGTVPGTRVVAGGATILRDGRTRDIARGRPTIELRPDPGDRAITLQAIDDTGGMSGLTEPLDLETLSRSELTQGPDDLTEMTVAYRIDRADVTRVQTVVLDPRRPELKDLAEGRLDTLGFLDLVAGRHGLAASSGSGCLVSQTGSSQPDVEIGERATVTIVDTFPDFITNANGFADRPVLTLCFPDGLPILGDRGHLEIRIADYIVVATSPRPTTIAIERSDAGVVERVYGWDSVPSNGAVRLTLAVDVTTSFGLVPKARLGNIIADPAIGALASGVFYALVQGAGLLLLLWLTASRLTREHFPAVPRHAVSDILTVGVAFAFLPAVAQLTTAFGYEAFDTVRATLALSPIASDLPAAPDDLGGWLLTLAIAVGSALVAWWFKRGTRPLWAHVFAAVALAAAMWLGLSILGRITMPIIAGQGVEPQDVPSLAAWAMGSIVLFATFVFTWQRLGSLRLHRRIPTLSGAVGLLAWGATAAILLAYPAGRQIPQPGAIGGPAALYDFIMHSFIPLLSYGYAMVGVAAVVLLIRMAWRRTSWEQLMQKVKGRSQRRSPEHLLRRIGRVIFAGYVIGTAGVFAVLPIPFLIAFALFDQLLLRRSSDTRRLAEYAPSIRRNRRALLEARIRTDDDAKDADPPREAPESADASRPPQPATVDGFPEAWVHNVAALGPRRPIWGDIMLGIQVGGALSAGLVLLYITQYPFGSVTTSDPYFLQRLTLNVAAFMASWVIIGFVFGLMYEHLRGESGLRKGLWLGAMILALTLPFQLLTTLASGLPLLTITIRVLQVLAFTVILGLTFDIWLLHRYKRLEAGRFVREVGGVSSTGLFWTGVLFIGGSIIGTVGTVVTGQLTELLSRILTPFLPLPPA